MAPSLASVKASLRNFSRLSNIIIDIYFSLTYSVAMNNSTRKMVTFSMQRSVIDDLEAWLDQQPVRPTKSAVMDAALRAFLGLPSGRGVAAKLRTARGQKLGNN